MPDREDMKHVEKLDQWMSVWFEVQRNRVLGIAKSITQMPCGVQIIFSSRMMEMKIKVTITSNLLIF